MQKGEKEPSWGLRLAAEGKPIGPGDWVQSQLVNVMHQHWWSKREGQYDGHNSGLSKLGSGQCEQ